MALSFFTPRPPASASGVVRFPEVPFEFAGEPAAELEPDLALPVALASGMPESLAPCALLRNAPEVVDLSFCAAASVVD